MIFNEEEIIKCDISLNDNESPKSNFENEKCEQIQRNDSDYFLSTNFSGENFLENYEYLNVSALDSTVESHQISNFYSIPESVSKNLIETFENDHDTQHDQTLTSSMKNYSPRLSGDYGFLLPIELRHKGKSKRESIINAIYKEMKSNNIKISRKFKLDCILKKIKVDFSKYNIGTIKKLQEKYEIYGKLKKLCQSLTTKINIAYEYENLLKPLYKLFQEDHNHENQRIVKAILKVVSTNDLEFLIIPVFEKYQEYLNSNYYKASLKKLENNPKYDSHYIKLYKHCSESYIDYYFTTAHNEKRNNSKKK
jgi:hypothetical protein